MATWTRIGTDMELYLLTPAERDLVRAWQARGATWRVERSNAWNGTYTGADLVAHLSIPGYPAIEIRRYEGLYYGGPRPCDCRQPPDSGTIPAVPPADPSRPAFAPCYLCGAPVAVTETHAEAHWIPSLCPDGRCRDRMPEADRARLLAEARAAIERGTDIGEAHDAVERLS